MGSKHPQKDRWTLLVLLVVMGIALAILICLRFNQTENEAAALANAVPLVHPTTAPVKALPRGNYIWLGPDQALPDQPGILNRELYRQALLIAGREGLGLQTRDSSLREWDDAPDQANGLEMDFLQSQISLLDAKGSGLRWKLPIGASQWVRDLQKVTATTEEMSRNGLVDALRKAGWNGRQVDRLEESLAPADAEMRLGEMEEISQFGAVREAHSAIRAGGESPQRLDVLVRGYANLGQLTRYHWSEEYAVYTARSLLYAQRMVAEYPKLPLAYWCRAYARALAGLPEAALGDLTAAQALRGSAEPPNWVKLLDPLCRYQTGTLVNLAMSDAKVLKLGMFLALLSVENSACQGAVMNIATAALAIDPRCLRIIDVMCENTGPGMLNELSETGPNTFSQTLGSDLQKVPGFPERLSKEIEGFRRPGGNPDGRMVICRELIDAGKPDRDETEPSWAALGRLIEETTFAHVAREANLIEHQWGVDASDYVQSQQAHIAGHP
jgi:hypothetical protein